MPSNESVPIVIVERNGDLRADQMSAYTPSVLRKKCKCKSSSKFEMHAEWAYSERDAPVDDRFIVELWACDDGAAGQENKYEFPPPVDTLLFFGSCALVAKDMTHRVIPLTLDKWDKMYNNKNERLKRLKYLLNIDNTSNIVTDSNTTSNIVIESNTSNLETDSNTTSNIVIESNTSNLETDSNTSNII